MTHFVNARGLGTGKHEGRKVHTVHVTLSKKITHALFLALRFAAGFFAPPPPEIVKSKCQSVWAVSRRNVVNGKYLPSNPVACAPHSARTTFMVTWTCHAHWVQLGFAFNARLPKGVSEATWKAMVCLLNASAVTPQCLRPNTMRPKHIPTIRAKNPPCVMASPRGLAQYGSWPKPPLPQILLVGGGTKFKGDTKQVGQSRQGGDAFVDARLDSGKTRNCDFPKRAIREGRKTSGTYSSGNVDIVTAYMPKYTCIAVS